MLHFPLFGQTSLSIFTPLVEPVSSWVRLLKHISLPFFLTLPLNEVTNASVRIRVGVSLLNKDLSNSFPKIVYTCLHVVHWDLQLLNVECTDGIMIIFCFYILKGKCTAIMTQVLLLCSLLVVWVLLFSSDVLNY